METDWWLRAAEELSRNAQGISLGDARSLMGELYIELTERGVKIHEVAENPVAYLTRAGYLKWRRQMGRENTENNRNTSLDSLQEIADADTEDISAVGQFSMRCTGERAGGLGPATKAAQEYCERFHLTPKDFQDICALGYAWAKIRATPKKRYSEKIRTGATLFATIYVARRRRR